MPNFAEIQSNPIEKAAKEGAFFAAVEWLKEKSH
jgi:hypothetical protein